MRTALTILATKGAEHQNSHAQLLAAGLRRHNVQVSIEPRHFRPSTKLVACWGWRIGQKLRAAGHEVLVMERGYLGDRFAWTSLSWNGLNNRGEFGRIPDDGGERFKKNFGALMEPWAPQGDYVLIIGQVRGDMSLQGRDLGGWYADQAQRFPGVSHFRPHPESIRRGLVDHVPDHVPKVNGPLLPCLKGARLVTTFNSNTAVESVLAGKPTLVEDIGSMAWDVRNTPDAPDSEQDRRGWAAQLAWKQWTADEIRNGVAWEHLMRRV
jgi:hypothetical protein